MAKANRNAKSDAALQYKLLFVSSTNIKRVVALVAPQFVLIDRAQFELVASKMCDMVEGVAKQPRHEVVRIPRPQFTAVAEEMLELVEVAAGA